MTNLTDYVCINHHLMTVKEMAEETGAPENTIRWLMTENGWELFSPVDRLKDYIRSHSGDTIEDIAEHLGKNLSYIRRLSKEMGIDLVTRFQSGIKKEPPPVEKVRSKYSLMHRVFHGPEPGDIQWALDTINRVDPETKPKHLEDTYNQIGSPYGLADQIKNVKIK